MEKEELIIKYKDVISYDLLCSICKINPDEHFFFVKPAVKKFMEKEMKCADPFFLDSNVLKDSLFSTLFKMTKEFPVEIIIKLCEYSPCVLPSPMGYYENIDRLFDKELKKAMCQWVTDFVISGNTAMSGIRSFLEYYDIGEDDYGMLSAHRAWMRYYHREYEKSRRRQKIHGKDLTLIK